MHEQEVEVMKKKKEGERKVGSVPGVYRVTKWRAAEDIPLFFVSFLFYISN